MRKQVLLLITLLLLTKGFAQSVTITKLANETITVNDNLIIRLLINNPFNEDVTIRLVDKNILGNNGLDIQCLEQTIKPGDSMIEYTPIKPFSSGEFTLGPATITYTNPLTSNNESVESNNVTVKVSGQSQGSAQGVTTIYRCGGMNMQSTSYSSSGGNVNIQMGGGGSGLQQQVNQMFNNGQSQSQSVNDNQLNQDPGALQQEMQDQLKNQQQLEDEFKQSLEHNSELAKTNQKLINQGYNLSSVNVNPSTNNTGSFQLSYSKDSGETASVKGEMNNGELTKLLSQSSEDREKMMDQLKNNPRFKSLNQSLSSKGYELTQTSFNQLSNSNTNISLSYNKSDSTAVIKAVFENNTITSVELLGKGDNHDYSFIYYLSLIIILAGSLIIYYKYFRKETKQLEVKPVIKTEKKINFKIKTKQLLNESRELANKGQLKNAFELMSYALRFFYSNKLANGTELITNEVLILTDNKELMLILESCDLIEFSGKKPVKKEFDKLISKSFNLIK